MELLVVGLGSMGKRRARLIRGVEPSAALAGVLSLLTSIAGLPEVKAEIEE